MTIPDEDGPIPCTLGDSDPLRRALLRLRDVSGELVAWCEPVQPYSVERRTILGRTKFDRVYVGAEVVFFGDETGAGQYCVNIHHPGDWPALASGQPQPEGSTITGSDSFFYSMDLSLTSSPAQAAAEIMSVLVYLFGPSFPPEWQVRVDELGGSSVD